VSFFSRLFADEDPMPEVREDGRLGHAGTRAVRDRSSRAGGLFSGHPWRYLGDADAYRRALKSVWR
jgi:hypothetical protein